MAKIDELRAQAEELGIETEGKTAKDLAQEIKSAQDGEDEDLDKADSNETAASRTPTAKARAKVVKPVIQDLYPWALNRAKAERAHNTILEEMRGNNEQNVNPKGLHFVSPDDFAQRVMDHYVSHGGLVVGQEKTTIVGRKGRMAKAFAPGKTTTEVIGGDDDEDEDAPANSKDNDDD